MGKKKQLKQIQDAKYDIKFKAIRIKKEHKTGKDKFRNQQTGLIAQFKKDHRKEQRAYSIEQEKNILRSTSSKAKNRKIRNKKIYMNKKNKEIKNVVNEKYRKLYGELKIKDIETKTEIQRTLIPLKMQLSKKKKTITNFACWIKVWNDFCKKTYKESRLRTRILYRRFCKIFFNTQSWLFKYLWAFTKVKKFCYINFFFKKERG
jgi:formylmethanofuran dehydrogenase subunit E-like metal-binding protein